MGLEYSFHSLNAVLLVVDPDAGWLVVTTMEGKSRACPHFVVDC